MDDLEQKLKETLAGIAELKEFQKTSQKNIETYFRETSEKFSETSHKFQDVTAHFKETDARIQRAFDLFETQWGKLVESLVEGDLVPILNQRSIPVERTSLRQKGKKQGIDFEFDIIAYNGPEIVIVEVKTTLRVKHVKKFIEQLKIIRQLLPEFAEDKYKIYGAVAYLQAQEESDVFAEKEKLFVIRATGNSASIINKKNFSPQSF